MQQDATLDTPKFCQVDDKTKYRVKVRSGMGTIAYWRARFFRNSCKDRHERTALISEWYIRLPKPSSLDSALVLSLPEGAYTAQVSGASGDTRVALVEVYEVQ